MFRPMLEEAGRRLPGCEAAALVGRDGMVVEHWAGPGGPSPEVLAAELTPVVRSVETFSRNSDSGKVGDLLLLLSSRMFLVRPINEEILLVMVAGRGTIPGRLRFEAARAAARLEVALR